MSSLTTAGLAVRYDTLEVLSDLDLAVAPGEWVALIGPNGAGKSTLLRAATGVVRPSTGAIRVGGDDPADLRPRDLARRVAMVPQHPTLPGGTTVTDYALLGRTPYIPYLGVESHHDREVLAGLLERLDMAPLADRPVDQLSGGEVQRAVLVRALAQQAPLLLLDEPTSALDVGHQLQVLELVESLRHEHELTVVSAMHDLTLAGQFADRMVLLDRGRTVAQGSARTVLTEDRIRTHYDANVRVLVDDDGGVVVVPVRTRGRTAADPRPADTADPPPSTTRAPEMPADPPRDHRAPERVHAPSRSPRSRPRSLPRSRPRSLPRSRPRSLPRSTVLLNTGDGKGKSTAAFGTLLRALARGWHCGVVQFLKSGDWRVGEEAMLTDLGVDWFTLGDGFTWESEDMDATQARAVAAWDEARVRIAAGHHDVLLLDEITYAVTWGWIDGDRVVDAIRERPEHVHVILTGRDADPRLVEVADTVTEMHKVRHAFDRGVLARRGIDY